MVTPFPQMVMGQDRPRARELADEPPSYQGLALSRHPHMSVRGVDELLEMLTAEGGRGA